ncbi:MAG TPA: cryptochrome/photolyase family protein [Verrucomicrobiae bacterium]|nr:cryptochrome/photolyase family protein [Verrucomicrobiae bacterium]
MQAFLLFSHQLFGDVVRQPRHSVIYLLEDSRLFRREVEPGIAIFHRAALQAVRERLLVKGFVVKYMGADEYPTLNDALAEIAGKKPEVVRHFTIGDSKLAAQVRAFCKKENIPVKELANATPRIKVRPRAHFVPAVLPPIEPNRYVMEAVDYLSRMVPLTDAIEFAYPVTKGDAEEWLELLPEIVRAGGDIREAARDLAPLVVAGLIDLSSLNASEDYTAPPEHTAALKALLFGA